MTEEATAELQRYFAALADEDRLKIAGRLALRPARVCELAAELGMKETALARHISVLTDLSIVQRTTDGSLELNVEGLRESRKRLLSRERAASPADAEGTAERDRTVLRNFFDGDTLKTIPADMNKRMVVLTWLANRFDPDRQYPEREVNEIIKRHHPDASALRRELVDHRFMARENGVYWRVVRAEG